MPSLESVSAIRWKRCWPGISDRAILLGKVIVTTGYAWGTAVLGLLLGLFVANLSKGRGDWEFYKHIDLLLEALALSLLVSLLGVSGGVLISMRSATVRQAQQILIVALLVLVAGGVALIKVLPAQAISSLSASQIWLIVMAVLAVLNAILAGSLAGEFPALPLDVELRSINDETSCGLLLQVSLELNCACCPGME